MNTNEWVRVIGLALLLLTDRAGAEGLTVPAAASVPAQEETAAAPVPAAVDPAPLAAVPTGGAETPAPSQAPGPVRKQLGPKIQVERLDAVRARIGTILLDRQARRFTVPGKVIWEKGPLEFLAVTKGGVKAYESLLELDTDALQFNVACLLIGLDSDWKRSPRFHFDPEPAQGKTVAVLLRWEQDGQSREVPANELFQSKGPVEAGPVWVYTGSRTVGDRYLAQQDGTLIGFAHDPATIIEHREGLGLGDYGSVGIRPGVLPPRGTAVEVEVRWMSRKEAGIPIPEAEVGPVQPPAPLPPPAAPSGSAPAADVPNSAVPPPPAEPTAPAAN